MPALSWADDLLFLKVHCNFLDAEHMEAMFCPVLVMAIMYDRMQNDGVVAHLRQL